MIDHETMLELKRWNTPTIYNGWEQITKHNVASVGFNIEEATDFMPEMGPMVGRAITVVFEPSDPSHRDNPGVTQRYRDYVASVDGPKIVVIQDLDKPRVIGSFWGEVSSNMHRALGCIGTIVDGAIRDLDEMKNAGFKALARRLCVGHAYSIPVSWGDPVEVFGTRIEPGQLIHADKHGFLAVPPEDEEALLRASRFMDSNENMTLISAARSSVGKSKKEIVDALNDAGERFNAAAAKEFGRTGEW